MTNDTIPTITSRGVRIPRLGLGTYGLSGRSGQAAIEHALSLGFRHLDTATMYGNETEVGAAVRASGIDRKEIFVTTKVLPGDLAPNALNKAFDTSISQLNLDYVDLYLVHWPSPTMDMAATLEAMLALRDAGRVRAIGVCNFNLPMIRHAVETIGAPIAAHQIEYHPFLTQAPMLTYLRSKGIPLTAYSPLAKGRVGANETLARIAAKHGVTASQIAIAWLLDQDGVIAIPKASRDVTQRANLAALSIRLDDEDRAAIEALPKTQRFVRPSWAPDWDAPDRD
jgi:2,5-diketo-D-gluconate reductase B